MTSLVLSHPLPLDLASPLKSSNLPSSPVRAVSCQSVLASDPPVPASSSSHCQLVGTPTAEHPLASSSFSASSSVSSALSSACAAAACTCCTCSHSLALPHNTDEKQQDTGLSTSAAPTQPSTTTTITTDTPPHPHHPTPLPSASSSSAAPSHSTTLPPLSRHRWLFYAFIQPRMLFQLNLCQLAIHTVLLYTSLVSLYQLTASHQQLRTVVAPSWCVVVLYGTVTYVMVRSMVHCVFGMVRCRYGMLWRLKAGHWFNSVRWGLRLVGLPLVMGAFAALSTLHPTVANTATLASTYSLLWALTSILLFHLLVSWAAYAFFLLIFPASQLTCFAPFLPLSPTRYPQGQRAMRRRKAGLSPRRIAQLSWTVWTASSTVQAGEGCSICMDELCGGEVVRRLECGHVYHLACVDVWLAKRAVCPLCVRRVGKEEQDEQVEMVTM